MVQLRRENAAGTLWGLVGFQTNLRFGEQKKVFSLIPGGRTRALPGTASCTAIPLSIPPAFDADLSLRSDPRIFFAVRSPGWRAI